MPLQFGSTKADSKGVFVIRRKILMTCVIVLTFSLLLSGCSSKNAKKSSSTKSSKSTNESKGGSSSSTNSKKAFQNEVAKICKSVDNTIFDEIETATASFGSDPEGFKKIFQDGEDELDRVIGKLDNVDPPAQWEDDWDTLIDDFSAIRDALPVYVDALVDLLRITNNAKGSSDPATIAAIQAEATKTQTELQALGEDLTQRGTEIGEIIERLGISNCALN